MAMKKLPLMALGLIAVCSQCDPLDLAEAKSAEQETGIQVSIEEVVSSADQEKYAEAFVNCLMEEKDTKKAGVSLVTEQIPTYDIVEQRKDELTEQARLEEEKAERIALRKAQVSKRIQVRAKALADARAKEEAEKEAAEREIAKDATGEYYKGIRLMYSKPYEAANGHLTRSNGSIRYNGHRETWYSTKEGCGQATAVKIPGKHIAEDGTIRDKDGYICVASNQSFMRVYSTLMTSLGPAKVYDTGCSYGTIDVYTCW